MRAMKGLLYTSAQDIAKGIDDVARLWQSIEKREKGTMSLCAKACRQSTYYTKLLDSFELLHTEFLVLGPRILECIPKVESIDPADNVSVHVLTVAYELLGDCKSKLPFTTIEKFDKLIVQTLRK